MFFSKQSISPPPVSLLIGKSDRPAFLRQERGPLRLLAATHGNASNMAINWPPLTEQEGCASVCKQGLPFPTMEGGARQQRTGEDDENPPCSCRRRAGSARRCRGGHRRRGDCH